MGIEATGRCGGASGLDRDLIAASLCFYRKALLSRRPSRRAGRCVRRPPRAAPTTRRHRRSRPTTPRRRRWLDASPSAARQLFDREGGSFSAAAGSGSDSDDSREPELISWIRKAVRINDDDDD